MLESVPGCAPGLKYHVCVCVCINALGSIFIIIASVCVCVCAISIGRRHRRRVDELVKAAHTPSTIAQHIHNNYNVLAIDSHVGEPR